MERLTTDAISRLHHVMITVGEMCTDRGYVVPKEWCPPTLELFTKRFVVEDKAINREAMTMITSRDSSDLIVYFNGEPAINTERVKQYVLDAQKQGSNSIILVIAGKVNAITKKYIDTQGKGENAVSMQLFEEDDLIVNITRHELVPKHVPLSDEEAQKVLAAFSLKASQLPRILSRDPIAQYFGMKKGQLFKITRKSETAGEYTTFRQVV